MTGRGGSDSLGKFRLTRIVVFWTLRNKMRAYAAVYMGTRNSQCFQSHVFRRIPMFRLRVPTYSNVQTCNPVIQLKKMRVYRDIVLGTCSAFVPHVFRRVRMLTDLFALKAAYQKLDAARLN